MKKFRKILALLLTLALAATLFTACAPKETPNTENEASTQENDANPYAITLGVVQPGPEDYYQNFTNAVKSAAEYAGMDVTVLLSEYSSETEIANIEDLLSRGIDAIACFSVASDTAQIDAQLCNEADVPLFLMTCYASEGEGVPTCSVGNSFYDMGYQNGQWVIDNLPDPQRVVIIEGQLGQGIAERISEGFRDSIEASGRDDIEIIYQNTANWIRADAISITEDMLASGEDFNLIFVHNEDMCAGVTSVLEENDMLGKINVIAQNGSDVGINLIKEGKLLSTVANPPSFLGGDVVVQIMKYLDGEEVPANYDSPSFVIDGNNVNDPNLVTWDVKWAASRVDDYLASKS